MSTSQGTSTTGLLTGSWQVDTAASTLAFSVKTFWGLLTVKGNFKQFDGTLTVTPDSASGTLTIQTASLDTKNAKRDTHLCSADFFDVDNHPTITFTLSSAESEHGHIHLDGILALPAAEIPLTLHTDAQTGDSVKLSTTTVITREDARLTWNQLGMIRNQIVLSADLVLKPAA